ncbi:MAG: hypothetical protein ABR915_08300 [Thermoguttaceae bacterium]
MRHLILSSNYAWSFRTLRLGLIVLAVGLATPPGQAGEPTAEQDGIVELRLDTMSVQLDLHAGKVQNAIAFSPLLFWGSYRVTCDLAVNHDKIDGDVTIAADPSRSPAPKDEARKYTVHAVLGQNLVSGEYEKSTTNGKETGQLRGRVGKRCQPGAFRMGWIWVEMDSQLSPLFLADYAQSRKRALIRFELVDGKATKWLQMKGSLVPGHMKGDKENVFHEGSFAPRFETFPPEKPNPDKPEGTFIIDDQCSVEIGDDTWIAQMAFRCSGGGKDAGRVAPGSTFAVKLHGKRVGGTAVGAITGVGKDGKEVRYGSFITLLTPSFAHREAPALSPLKPVREITPSVKPTSTADDARPLTPLGGLTETWADRLGDGASFLYPPVFGAASVQWSPPGIDPSRLYPPGYFAAATAPKANAYQVEITQGTLNKSNQFTPSKSVPQWKAASLPISLAQAWEKLEPAVAYQLTATALNPKGDPKGAPVLTRVFQKSPPFPGNRWETVSDSSARIRQHLETLNASTKHAPFCDPMLTGSMWHYHSKCQETYPYVGYGAVVAHLTLVRLVDTAEAKQELTMKAALAGEWLAANAGVHSLWVYHWKDCIQTPFGGLAFVELFKATGEKRWAEYARRFALTLQKTQLPNGTWRWMGGDGISGESQGASDASKTPYPEYDAAPFLYFLGRYRTEVHNDEFLETERKALAWEMDHSLKTFYWRPQQWAASHFIDCYRSTAPLPPTRLCQYLLECPCPGAKVDPAAIAEVIRYCEDRFLDWSSLSPGFTPFPRASFVERDTSHLSRLALVMALADQANGQQYYRSRIDYLIGSIYALQSPTSGVIPWEPMPEGWSLDSPGGYMTFKMAETAENLLRIAEILQPSSPQKAKSK